MFEAIGGFLHLLMTPIYWAMSGILVGAHALWSAILPSTSGWTWVLAIISLTVVIRTLMIPLFVKQINSSRAMQLIAPKAKAIQDKYKDDREKAGQAVMDLYREEGVNPMASCLPVFVQMPIFIGLFTVLNGAARGNAVGYWLERSPELVDSLRSATIFGAPISGTLLDHGFDFGPTFLVAAFLIAGMVITLFLTQWYMMRKNMPPESLEGPMAQQQKMMLYIFPAMYLFTGVSFPIGVMIYWLASNTWTLAQQWILIRNNPTPNTPAFIDWQERQRAKGRDPEKMLQERQAKIRRKQNKGKDGATSTTSVPHTVTDATAAVTDSSPTTSTTDASGPAKQRVQRQQPQKRTRATRKQSRSR